MQSYEGKGELFKYTGKGVVSGAGIYLHTTTTFTLLCIYTYMHSAVCIFTVYGFTFSRSMTVPSTFTFVACREPCHYYFLTYLHRHFAR